MIAPSMLIDAIVLASLGIILMKWYSRTAAVPLVIVSILQASVTILNRVGATSQGGKNVFLGLIMLVVAARTVEATFKLHGKFGTRALGMANRAARVTTGR